MSVCYSKISLIMFLVVFTGDLPCTVGSVKITATVPDTKTKLVVAGDKSGVEVPLNYGCTRVTVDVTSPDGSNTQV